MMEKKIYRLLAAALALTVLLLGGCGSTEKNKAADGKPKATSLIIGIMPDVDSVPIVIAREKGYFAAAGVEVAVSQFRSAVDRDAAIQSGQVDGAVSDMLAAAFFRNGGFNVRVTSLTDGSYQIVGSPSGDLKNIAALRGRDVAVSRNTIIEYVTDRALATAGLTGDDIEKKVIPQIPTRLEMLKNGKVAAATLPEPMASLAVADGCVLIETSDKLGINPGVMLFTEAACAQKREAITRFYRAYNQAVKYLNETDRTQYRKLVVEKCNFPAAAETALTFPRYNKAALPAKRDWEQVAEWLTAKKLVKNTDSYENLVWDVLPR